MESSSARIRAAPLRFMVTPLTSGREPVYVGDRVTAPCKGYDGVYAGMVKAINVQHRTLYVMFDDGDEDEAVAIRSVRHVRGADACMPTLKRGARAAGLQMRPKPKKLRLPQRPPPPAGPKDTEPKWTHLGFTSMCIAPPPPGCRSYDNLSRRTVFSYRWTWEKEAISTARMAKVTLHDIVNEVKAPYAGMHVAALRYFMIELGTAAAMTAPTVAHFFGSYDPYV